MKRHSLAILSLILSQLLAPGSTPAAGARIEVNANEVRHPVSRWLTGACIEDVNHEIYGGIYSQMVFGESFQEPAPFVLPGFLAFDGSWTVNEGEVLAPAGAGPKLISDAPAFQNGEAGVEVFFLDRTAGNAGLIVRVARPDRGADAFDGYEIALSPAQQQVRLARHRQDFALLQDAPCDVPVGRWISLTARLDGTRIEVLVDGHSVLLHTDSSSPLPAGTVGLRQWQREARYRNFWMKAGTAKQSLPFVNDSETVSEVSEHWRLVRRGTTQGSASIIRSAPFVGSQSQRLSFKQGTGEIGVENQGLNRWGMHFAAHKSYDGILWVRPETASEVWVALESADGSKVYAESALACGGGEWQPLHFSLTAKESESRGRFAVKLKQPGSIQLGYAFLQPGEWGRFKSLPVRRDVAEALIDQGITVLRYGGSMINHPEYRWKKMVGPRDRRPPYRGTWYAHSSNGWGILDFMDFCEAAGFEYIPAFNIDETPQDMADFIDYAKGQAGNPWADRRIAAGHPKPYALRFLELGNEERVDENYAAKFQALAETIWARDPNVILIVGDFVYGEPIRDPFNFRGAASGITNLAGQQQILRLAKKHNREVWFDIHVGTDGPRPDSTFAGMFSFRDALTTISEGAQHRVVVFEFNAGNPTHRRALANALAIQAIERDGQIPIACSANCLQPDGQNDNGWDQGLLFLNPSSVWLQSPGHVTRIFSRNYLPQLVECRVTATASALDANAKRSDDGKTLVLQVVNPTDEPASAELVLSSFLARRPVAEITELTGPLDAKNTATAPTKTVPQRREWRHELSAKGAHYTFAPRSVTFLRFE